jgi:hypothetical protein
MAGCPAGSKQRTNEGTGSLITGCSAQDKLAKPCWVLQGASLPLLSSASLT